MARLVWQTIDEPSTENRIMDCRITLGAKETFEKLLNSAYHAGEKVNLLVDDNGLTRAEGFIQQMKKSDTSLVIELDNGMILPVGKIVAVNGIFLPAYGEC
ncbi:MAG TPA: hypothetical protein VGN63_11850 [Flavisolibacter sp.]|nr:hypothetical protein [Flavisolibacter sp.]